MAKKQESYFWTSYSDLMTSLFFVMLVLFVLASAMLKNKIDDVEMQKEIIEKQKEQSEKEKEQSEKEKEATEKELAKIREIEQSIEAIDPKYFEYNAVHKKHILKINVQFNRGSYFIDDIPESQQRALIDAGKSISKFLRNSPEDVKYLLIIEGQASNDNYPDNDGLSFRRANSLNYFWKENGINFGDKCEIIVSGSGVHGVMRSNDNEKNQRFLIHIIPKPGVLDRIENETKK